MANDTKITADGTAQLYTLPAALADFMLHRTEAGYPQMAALAFHPDEEDPDPPTNYHSVEQWTTASTDNLQLSAVHYSPENPTGKWVILVHGYGKKGAAMNAFAEPYLAQGLDVLIVDQRTAGDSEGDWLTMGVAEANDLAIWTQEIAKTNANAQITLHGVSMGAATVMLCAALPETTNVSAMIEDCGYGNIADVFATLLTYYGRSLGVGDVDYYELFDEVAAVAKTLDGGYDVGDAAPIDSIAAVTVPSLFIHGAADVVIPSTNADALYEASGASNKTKLIVEGAGHAQSIELDTEAYLAAVRKLIDSSTIEIGASIDSDADNISLRGTIYNDTITNSGHSVTIEALGGDDYITNNVDSSVTAAEFGNLIDLGDGNDTIYNHHSYNPTIYGGAGDDSIVISRGHKTFVDGGDGNDSIIGRLAGNPDNDWEMGGYATIISGNGNDFIDTGYTNDSSIDGGDGNDTISVSGGEHVTISGGAGNDSIKNYSASSFVNGGADDDEIENRSDYTTLFGGDGIDSILNHTDHVSINGGAGNDSLFNGGSNNTVEGGEGDDFIYNGGANNLVYAGAGNDTVRLYTRIENVTATIDTGEGNDYVENNRATASINSGTGDDSIVTNSGDNVTINASAGNDFVSLGSASALVEYSSGDGNDIIEGFRADSTLSIASGKYSSAVSGDDVIISVNDGKITLTGAASLDTVNIDGEKDESRLFVTNSDSVKVKLSDEIEIVDASMRTKPFVISGNDLNNTISGSKALDLIYSGNGDDFVNSGLGNDKVWGGNGNDTLLGNAGNDYLSGGYGTDKLYGGSGNDTLIGGKNNDSLWGNGGADTFIYEEGDNKDVIYGFEDDDMLQITGKFVAAYGADNNVISFKVGDTSNAIVLKDFTATTFNVNGDDYVISGNKLVKK